MNRRSLLLGAAVITLSFSGCLDPRFTRMPQFHAAHPVSESRSFQHYDPYPSSDIGPETYLRPRGFTHTRTEPRRAAEQRMLKGLWSSPETIPPYAAPNARRYSGSVR